MKTMVKLGDEVKDNVTGFKGIVTSTHSYLNGCRRVNVQPPIDKEGKYVDSLTFDEPQLKVIKSGKIKIGPQDTGGPEKDMPRARCEG